jgi:hypothetical protein
MNSYLPQSRQFLLVAIICCFLSVITTLGIHSSLFSLGSLDFDQRIRLFENPTYLLNRFWIIFHCLFVLLSMWGFLLIQFKKSPGYTGLGFVFFSVFSFTEIFRQMLVLFYLNNLRRSYLDTTDVATQEMIKTNMEHTGLIGYALFGLFIIAFALGNIFYGLALADGSKRDRILAALLLLWGIGNLLAFANEFWLNERLSNFLEAFNIGFQPLMRTLIGLWMLWKWKQVAPIKERSLP